MKTRRQRMSQEERKKSLLEEGWNDSYRSTKMKEYNALFDLNMRHFFEAPSVQTLLLKTGQIDRNGRVIDFQKQKSKLHIIEQEFNLAEKIEYWREKEERDMRDRVQKKRAMALERARKEEMIQHLHEDRRIRQEIVRASLEAQGMGTIEQQRIRTGTRESISERVHPRCPRPRRRRRRSWSQGAERIGHDIPGKFPETSSEGNERAMGTFVTEGEGVVAAGGVAPSSACDHKESSTT